jgi:hypothetical protein
MLNAVVIGKLDIFLDDLFPGIQRLNNAGAQTHAQIRSDHIQQIHI